MRSPHEIDSFEQQVVEFIHWVIMRKRVIWTSEGEIPVFKLYPATGFDVSIWVN